jgi:phosphatidyl-myo-inositol dimannoside synthase
MSKILVLTPSIYPQPGGLERYTYYLASSLSKRHSVVVLSLLFPGSQPPQHANLDYYFPSRFSKVGQNVIAQVFQKVYLFFLLLHLHNQYKFEQVICTWWDPLGYIVLVLAKLYRVPYLCVAHGQEVSNLQAHSIFQTLKFTLRRLTFRQAKFAVAVSRFTGERLAMMGVPREKIRVIPNGLSSEYLDLADTFSKIDARQQLNMDGEKIILQVGRLVERKGHETVLAAIARVTHLDWPIKYVIAGDGPYRRYLEKKCLELGVEKQVTFTGRLSDNQLHQYYCAADLVVLPSHNPLNASDVEGFGIVLLEAYAHGKAVIGSATGGIPDAILQQKTGLLIPPGDSEQLAAGISYLLTNPEESARLGEEGKLMTRQVWNWDILQAQYIL